jgi:hypothetical protein
MSLFDLPTELRTQIWKDVLSTPRQGPDLLRTCREISNEARKCLYQRPINLGSQEALCDWSSRVPSELLLDVCQIALHVQDVDLKPIIDSDSSETSHSSPRLLTWELYQHEVHRVEQALKRLPKLKIITLRPQPCGPSILYREFVRQVLNILATSCTELVDLRLEGTFHHHDLSFLSSLGTLRAFSFDGFSLSSPTTTANILANLPHLRSLSLVSERTLVSPGVGSHSNCTSSQQSFTGEVLRTMDHLASFSVTERIPPASQTMFFTSDLLVSLHDNQTLTGLSVNLSHAPDTHILQSLEHFLGTSSIQCLELDWPGLHAGLLEQHEILCASLTALWIRASSQDYAFNVLSSVADNLSGKDFFSLAKVVLLRSKKEAQDWSGDGKHSGAETAKLEAHEVSLFHASFLIKLHHGISILLAWTLWLIDALQDNTLTHESGDVKIVRAKQRLLEMGIYVAWCTDA